jgi:hypothetical protein
MCLKIMIPLALAIPIKELANSGDPDIMTSPVSGYYKFCIPFWSQSTHRPGFYLVA